MEAQEGSHAKRVLKNCETEERRTFPTASNEVGGVKQPRGKEFEKPNEIKRSTNL